MKFKDFNQINVYRKVYSSTSSSSSSSSSGGAASLGGGSASSSGGAASLGGGEEDFSSMVLEMKEIVSNCIYIAPKSMQTD